MEGQQSLDDIDLNSLKNPAGKLFTRTKCWSFVFA